MLDELDLRIEAFDMPPRSADELLVAVMPQG